MGTAAFVSFHEVKEAVSLVQVLERYGLLAGLKPRGEDALTGVCPVHKGTNPTQFRVSLSKNVWNCFGGCSGGNVLDFVAAMEGVDIRQAALLLAQWFGVKSSLGVRSVKTTGPMPVKTPEMRPGAAYKEIPAQAPVPQQMPTSPRAVQEEARNTPLSFSGLKNLDPGHEYLAKQGFSREAMEKMGVGYCVKGLMRGRIAVPIHNVHGELVAYAGKSSEEAVGTGEYKYPEGFRQELELYNLHRAVSALGTNGLGLIVTADLFDVLRLYEAGYETGVALTDHRLSEAQQRLIRSVIGEGEKISLLFPVSFPAIAEVLAALVGFFYVRLWRTEVPPALLSADQIQKLLG